MAEFAQLAVAAVLVPLAEPAVGELLADVLLVGVLLVGELLAHAVSSPRPAVTIAASTFSRIVMILSGRDRVTVSQLRCRA